ncbi:hypothetical protein BCR44DRAFT_1429846, partial [Catenaria anguillulae PL171]
TWKDYGRCVETKRNEKVGGSPIAGCARLGPRMVPASFTLTLSLSLTLPLCISILDSCRQR